MKYIVFEYQFTPIAILFHEVINHDSFKYLHPISAGFCRVGKDINDDYKVTVWGKSVSLKLESKEEDEEIIKKSLTYRV